MAAFDHQALKSQITAACLEAFPEAKAIVLWGGITTADFQAKSSDVDVIIEIDESLTQEARLAERLKALVQSVKFCHLDPFLYLSKTKEGEPLEFIAPFGFYKANPFIPHLLQNQNEVVRGESLLLGRLKKISLAEALLSYHPQVMASLRRLRMDAEIETAVEPILGKHRAALFVILRTLYAFHKGALGSKKAAIEYFAQRYPRYEALAAFLTQSLEGENVADAGALTPELVLAFSHDMAEALQAAKNKETAH